MDRKVLGVRVEEGEGGLRDTGSEVSVWVRLVSSDYSLTDRQEVFFQRNATLNQVATILTPKFPHIHQQFMMTRIMNVCSFNRYQLSTLDWHSLQGDTKLSAYPLFI